jgi:excisionase family DNA binding protein
MNRKLQNAAKSGIVPPDNDAVDQLKLDSFVGSRSLETTAAKPEPFVTPQEAAAFLRLSTRRILEMARSGQLPAHPLGIGRRHRWRFRLGELAHAMVATSSATLIRSSQAAPRDLDRRNDV